MKSMTYALIMAVFGTALAGTGAFAAEDPATEAAFSKCMAALGETQRNVSSENSGQTPANSAQGHQDVNVNLGPSTTTTVTPSTNTATVPATTTQPGNGTTYYE